MKVKDIFKRLIPIMPAGSWLQRGGDGVMDQGCTWLELSVEGLDQSDCERMTRTGLALVSRCVKAWRRN